MLASPAFSSGCSVPTHLLRLPQPLRRYSRLRLLLSGFLHHGITGAPLHTARQHLPACSDSPEQWRALVRQHALLECDLDTQDALELHQQH